MPPRISSYAVNARAADGRPSRGSSHASSPAGLDAPSAPGQAAPRPDRAGSPGSPACSPNARDNPEVPRRMPWRHRLLVESYPSRCERNSRSHGARLSESTRHAAARAQRLASAHAAWCAHPIRERLTGSDVRVASVKRVLWANCDHCRGAMTQEASDLPAPTARNALVLNALTQPLVPTCSVTSVNGGDRLVVAGAGGCRG